jgi:hypothetical protein
MAKFDFNDFGNATSAAFLGDFGNREHILAGGAQLDSTATFPTEVAETNTIPAGTLVGRTIAERAAGAAFGPAADADDEVFITVADVDLDDANEDDRVDVDLVRHGTLIKIDLLPSYAGASAAVKTKLEAKYQLILG